MQVTLADATRSIEHALGDLPYFFDWNCAHVSTPYFMAHHHSFTAQDVNVLSDPMRALLQFMIAATPNASLVQDIMENSAPFLAKVAPTWEMQFVGGEGSITVLIDNVPDAVSSVKARLAFVQVPQGESTALELI